MRRTSLADAALRRGSLAALAGAVLLLVLVVGYIFWESRIPPSSDVSLAGFLLFDRWDPTGQPHQLGIGHAWMATLLIVGLAVALATPLAIAIGIFMAEIAPPVARAI